jgi:hypothetical protein
MTKVSRIATSRTLWDPSGGDALQPRFRDARHRWCHLGLSHASVLGVGGMIQIFTEDLDKAQTNYCIST